LRMSIRTSIASALGFEHCGVIYQTRKVGRDSKFALPS
jgi:hypothetical protein